MQVQKLVVHSVDNSLDAVVLSKRQVNLNQNAALDTFIQKFYKGILNSSASYDGILNEASILNQSEDIAFNFMSVSTTLAQTWFDHYEGSTRHTALNLIFALITDKEKTSFAMFEVTSRSGFLRKADEDENEIEHSMGIMSDSLASVKTAFVYELNEKTLKVRHAKESQIYLEEMLSFETIPNTKKNLEILDAMVDYVSEKRSEDVFQNTIKSKQLILDNSEVFEEIEPKRILETIFNDFDEDERLFIDETIQDSKMSALIPSQEVNKLSARKKHKLKTESGIDITLPLDSLRIEEVFEVIENPDGTVDILIKNVGGIE